MKSLLKRLLTTLKSYIPRPLPTGMTSFNAWVEEIAILSGLPDNGKLRQVAATFILHTSPDVVLLSTRHIANQLKKAAAYQVAQEVIKLESEASKAKTEVVSEA